jgi:hypothetical protein
MTNKRQAYRDYLEETITEWGVTERHSDGRPYRWGIRIKDKWHTPTDPPDLLNYKKIQKHVFWNHQIVLLDTPNAVWVEWFEVLVLRGQEKEA